MTVTVSDISGMAYVCMEYVCHEHCNVLSKSKITKSTLCYYGLVADRTNILVVWDISLYWKIDKVHIYVT